MAAWNRGPQASATFGSCTWALTSDLLAELWAWELKWLRRVFRLRWNRNKVGYVEYIKNTAARIKNWFAFHRVQPIHVRVLTSYHAVAWRESRLQMPGGARPLLWIRLFRARSLWESVKTHPLRICRQESWAQRQQRTIPAWDDVLARHLGAFWRQTRDKMTKAVWKEMRDDFIAPTWAIAKLPTEGYKFRSNSVREEGDASNKDRLRFSGNMPEENEIADTPAALLAWEPWEVRFLFISDSKVLVDVLNGRAALHDEEDIPILERIVTRLHSLVALGWNPPSLLDDPVVWMPRAHNKIADGLADLTMDRKESWERNFHRSVPTSCCTIVVQTNGGRRSEKCAAASMIVGVLSKVDGVCSYEPWFAKGLYFEASLSVFQTEAIALEAAIAWVTREIREHACAV
eukprot:TRINITY_DN16000_c0_g1_i2.p1 TRINITY_DN16000_c0_g1~~TRINITY_DN16000_c0_g1_i2.p1  ORF type:complete len:403 (-),score=38.54 TRINITY_DN16000_c0_g1_i2:13-1221(-)